MSITLVCDDCGKRVENTQWARPGGWTGDALGVTRPDTYKTCHRCDECNAALKEAADQALARRHDLYRERLKQDPQP